MLVTGSDIHKGREPRKLCIIYIERTHWRFDMSKAAITRTNLLLEVSKIRQLRKALKSRSNSEAVRITIDERLSVEAGLAALRTLRKLGGPEDVFGRASAKNKR